MTFRKLPIAIPITLEDAKGIAKALLRSECKILVYYLCSTVIRNKTLNYDFFKRGLRS